MSSKYFHSTFLEAFNCSNVFWDFHSPTYTDRGRHTGPIPLYWKILPAFTWFFFFYHFFCFLISPISFYPHSFGATTLNLTIACRQPMLLFAPNLEFHHYLRIHQQNQPWTWVPRNNNSNCSYYESIRESSNNNYSRKNVATTIVVMATIL